MYRVKFLDLYSKKEIGSTLDEIPRTGDLLQLTNDGKCYIVRGISREIDELEGRTNSIVLYLENANQTYWMNSLTENH